MKAFTFLHATIMGFVLGIVITFLSESFANEIVMPKFKYGNEVRLTKTYGKLVFYDCRHEGIVDNIRRGVLSMHYRVVIKKCASGNYMYHTLWVPEYDLEAKEN